MKSRETKQKDLAALTESLAASKSAMVVSFSKVTVTKDQEFRNSLREAGASYQIVKNTLARIAVKGTQFEDATEHFKGVTAIAWTDNDPVVLSKAISKFMKDNADIYTFKAGVVDGKLLDLTQLTTIANLPSKDELMAKLLYVLNSSAQRLVTVINAVPRDLAVVIKQIGEGKPAEVAAEEVKAEKPAAAPAGEVAAPVETKVSVETLASEEAAVAEAPAEEAVVEAAPDAVEEMAAEKAEETTVAELEAGADETPASEAESEETVAAPDDKAEEALEMSTEAQSPDDKAEEVLETPTEAEAEEKA